MQEGRHPQHTIVVSLMVALLQDQLQQFWDTGG